MRREGRLRSGRGKSSHRGHVARHSVAVRLLARLPRVRVLNHHGCCHLGQPFLCGPCSHLPFNPPSPGHLLAEEACIPSASADPVLERFFLMSGKKARTEHISAVPGAGLHGT